MSPDISTAHAIPLLLIISHAIEQFFNNMFRHDRQRLPRPYRGPTTTVQNQITNSEIRNFRDDNTITTITP